MGRGREDAAGVVLEERLLGAGDHDQGDRGGGELSTRCLLQWCLGISKVT